MKRVVLRNRVTMTEIIGHLMAGRIVQIDDFGTFAPSSRVARNIRHPQTKAMLRLPKMHSVKFKAAKFLKQLMTERAR